MHIQSIKLPLIHFALRLLRFVPLRALHMAGNVTGSLMARFPGTSTEVTRRNLALCFPALPPEQLQQLTRQSLQETAKTAFELGRVWTAPVDNVLQLVHSLRGEALLQEGLAAGKGVIILGPHIGNWELFGLKLSQYGQTTYLYKPPKVHEFEALMTEYRRRAGAALVPTDRRGVMQLLKALERGEIVGILPDQEPEMSGGVFAPFFGVDALTMTLASRLSEKTGAVILSGFARRLPDAQGFEVVILPADPAAAAADPLEAAAGLNRSVEACVNEAPSQYQWEYKRFRKRPDGEPRLY